MKVTLKEVRTSRGLSQNQLARAVNMTPQYIQKIEYGKIKSVPLDTLNKFCRALNCQTGDLLVYVPDDDKNQGVSLELEQFSELEQSRESTDNKPPYRHGTSRSFLTVVITEVPNILEVPESA